MSKREGPVVQSSPNVEDAAHEIEQQNLVDDIVSYVHRVTRRAGVSEVIQDLFPQVFDNVPTKPAIHAGIRLKIIERVHAFSPKSQAERTFLYMQIFDKLMDTVRSQIRQEYTEELLMGPKKK